MMQTEMVNNLVENTGLRKGDVAVKFRLNSKATAVMSNHVVPDRPSPEKDEPVTPDKPKYEPPYDPFPPDRPEYDPPYDPFPPDTPKHDPTDNPVTPDTP